MKVMHSRRLANAMPSQLVLMERVAAHGCDLVFIISFDNFSLCVGLFHRSNILIIAAHLSVEGRFRRNDPGCSLTHRLGTLCPSVTRQGYSDLQPFEVSKSSSAGRAGMVGRRPSTARTSKKTQRAMSSSGRYATRKAMQRRVLQVKNTARL